MNKINITATAALLITAMIWGLSYSAQAEAMKTMAALSFVFWRYLIGAVMLLPVIFFMKKIPDKKLVGGGVICGICLAGGEILQQFGLLYTTAGKAGFLTALYVIMIPLIGIFIRRKNSLKIWISAILSVIGTCLLCSDGSLTSFGNFGDLLMLICALFFAFQFIAIARFAPQADALLLAAVQFFTVAVISGAAAIIAGEKCPFSSIAATAAPLLYCGMIAIGLACTVQVAAQKYLHPATVSIILSTASVFAVIWGWMLLGERYSLQNLIGCAVIFSAVVMVQLPEKAKKADAAECHS